MEELAGDDDLFGVHPFSLPWYHTVLGTAVSKRRVNHVQTASMMMSCIGYWLASPLLKLKQYISSANYLPLQDFFQDGSSPR